MAPIIKEKKKNRWRSVVTGVTTRRKSSFTTLCYVFVESSSNSSSPDPLSPSDSAQNQVMSRNPRRIWRRIRARTLTRLAINLFVLLNVILFYRWIKWTSNLTRFYVYVLRVIASSSLLRMRLALSKRSIGTPWDQKVWETIGGHVLNLGNLYYFCL